MENGTNVNPYQLPTSEGCCLPSPFFQWHTRYTPSSVQGAQTWTWAESGRLCYVGNNGPASAGDAKDAAAVQSSGDAQGKPVVGDKATQLGSGGSPHAETSSWTYKHSGKFLKLSIIMIPCVWPFLYHLLTCIRKWKEEEGWLFFCVYLSSLIKIYFFFSTCSIEYNFIYSDTQLKHIMLSGFYIRHLISLDTFSINSTSPPLWKGILYNNNLYRLK